MIRRLAVMAALIAAVVVVLLLGSGAHAPRPVLLAAEGITLAQSDSLALAAGFQPRPKSRDGVEQAPDQQTPERPDTLHHDPLTSEDSVRAIEKLASDINAIVNLPSEKKSGKVGIDVRSLVTNKVLYTMNPENPLTPASTTKVVTTFTALSELGPNYMVRTIVTADAKPTRDGVVKGNLYVKGYGDPFLSVNEIDTLIDQLVASGVHAVEGNIVGDGTFFDNKTERTQYSGDDDVVVPLPPIAALTIGQSVFSVVVSSPRTPGEPVNIQTFPHSSGFEIINNAVTASPKAPARKATKRRGKRHSDVYLPDAPSNERFGDESPSNYDTEVFQRKPSKKGATTTKSATVKKSAASKKSAAAKKAPVKGKATATKSAASKKSVAKSAAVKKAPAKSTKTVAVKKAAPVEEDAPVAVNRGPIRVMVTTGENGKQIITVSGSLPPNRTVSQRYQMKNPPLVIAGMVYDRLRSHGITIGGLPTSGSTPVRSKVLAETGRPLLEILQIVMKNSNNFLAEYVFKMIGAAAGGQNETARKSVEKIQHRMSLNHVPFTRCIINDGSGLSRANCLSATALTGILNAAYNDKRVFDSFYSTMSIAGVDGTLRKRMKGTYAQGNVHGKTGTLRNVSALAGYVTTRDGELLCFSILMNGGNHGSYRAVQDKVAARLAAFSYGETLATLSK